MVSQKQKASAANGCYDPILHSQVHVDLTPTLGPLDCSVLRSSSSSYSTHSPRARLVCTVFLPTLVPHPTLFTSTFYLSYSLPPPRPTVGLQSMYTQGTQ